TGASLPVTLCSRHCDPIAQTGCPSGAGCVLYADDAEDRHLTDCVAGLGTGTQGDPCTDGSECAGGFACLDPDAGGAEPRQCLHWCDVVSGNGCATGEDCFG